MPDISCPACGAGGRVPREKMHTRLVCRKCLQVFHLSPSGKAMLGEPPVQKEALIKERAPKEASSVELSGAFDDLASRLSKIKLPKVSPQTLGIVAGIVLLACAGYWFFSKQSLEKRSETVAKAIMNADMKTVIELAAPGTEMDAIRWCNDAVRQYGDVKISMAGMDARVKLKVLSDSSSGPAVVVAQFSSEGTRLDGKAYAESIQPVPSLSNTNAMLELPLYWVKDFWGNWVLDGKRTAERTP
jgi:hypothetical protein